MLWIKAIREGFLGGRGKALSALLFYGAGLVLSTLALRPLAAGFDRAFASSPAAASLLSGRGLDLLAELGISQPGLWAAAFSVLGWVLALHLIASLYVTAGTYGVAALGDERPSSSFWARARRNFLPFAGLLALNLIVWAVILGILAVPVLAVGHSLRESNDPGPAFRLFVAELAVLAVVLNLFRNSVGYAQARYALTGGGEGLGRCFLRSFAFTFRRFVPVNLVTWIVNLLRVCAMALALIVLSPGYATSGKSFITALLLQAGFLALAFLRVAEIRTQVAYQRAFLEGTPAGEPVPSAEAAVEGGEAGGNEAVGQ
jgi:hypothetical protein